MMTSDGEIRAEPTWCSFLLLFPLLLQWGFASGQWVWSRGDCPPDISWDNLWNLARGGDLGVCLHLACGLVETLMFLRRHFQGCELQLLCTFIRASRRDAGDVCLDANSS